VVKDTGRPSDAELIRGESCGRCAAVDVAPRPDPRGDDLHGGPAGSQERRHVGAKTALEPGEAGLQFLK